jgi:hypothetical protein
MDKFEYQSKFRARWAGVCLLGALAGLVASLTVVPSFDARPEYFSDWLPGLVIQRFRYGLALGLILLTGGFVITAGLAIQKALRSVGGRGAMAGIILVASGSGFLLSALLGIPLVVILSEAARLPQPNWNRIADIAYPWASGNQAMLILIGLGGFAAGLLATAMAIILAGGISPRLAIVFALTPLIPLAVFLIIPGEDPYIWLSVGLPSLVWSISLGGYLAITGRVEGVAGWAL